MGKLNIWQWLGVVLLIVGAVMYVNRNSSDKDKLKPAPATQPAATPVTPSVPALPTQPATVPG